MKRCRTCLMPDTRPRVVFDETGQCNACRHGLEKWTIDWNRRRAEATELADWARNEAKARGNAYDCVVAYSGGKDSAAVAWRVKNELGLKPLLVTYGQLLLTDCGRKNYDSLIHHGFEAQYWRVDQAVSRKLARRFFIERGHPKLAYDSAVNAVPLITATKYNIPLVWYAEFGEAEYGGLVLKPEAHRQRDLAEVLENQVGDDARNWAGDGISERDLYPYIYPDLKDIERVGVQAHYFSYYFRWSSVANYQFIASKIDWHCPQRSEGTFTNFDSIDDDMDPTDYYCMGIKYGFFRAVRDANRHIQNGFMTREEGRAAALPYEGEFPAASLGRVLEYLDMTESEFRDTIELHRNPECWAMRGNQWELKCPL